ncbi:AraC family transcriptional regulator [Algibacter mikhailovii]|uniref:AraC family transcriptional regulator n=1 Tax=Algibacter mikhailovii TaxID=425498 RepID=UPI0024949A51|nr:helix-turn-helix domain-containing protein [Algibacter mikhailovii]
MESKRSVAIPQPELKKVIKHGISSMLYLTNIGHYSKVKSHYRLRREGCSEHILIYCTAGNGWISVNGRRVMVKKNQYFIIPKDIPHSYGSNKLKPWSIYWIHFLGKTSNEYAYLTKNPQTILPSNIDRIDNRIELFEEIFQNLEMGFSKENFEYANICLLHFLASFKFLDQYREIRKHNHSEGVLQCIRFMKSNISRAITLTELAKNMDLSVSQFSLLFKRKTGKSPLDYLIQLRIQKACELLDQTNLKIKDIAVQVGYQDPYYFSRIFTKTIGNSARDYRKYPKG